MVRIVPESYLKISRLLRKRQTPWEIKLWKFLRAGRFNDIKFKRQYKIGNYIVDFYCGTRKLVIELDGGQHNDKQKQIQDHIRQNFLESQGFKVLRFWNSEIDNNIEGVLETIKKEIDK
jgi:very-short-patch-repair endonuclease